MTKTQARVEGRAADATIPSGHRSTITVSDLSDLVAAAREILQPFNHDTAWWRGHANVEWRLVPQVFRRNPERREEARRRMPRFPQQRRPWTRLARPDEESGRSRTKAVLSHPWAGTALLDRSLRSYPSLFGAGAALRIVAKGRKRTELMASIVAERLTARHRSGT